MTTQRTIIDTKQEKRIKKKNINNKRQDEVLKILNGLLKREFRVFPEREGNPTLEIFTNEQIKQALTELVKDDWHRPKLDQFKSSYLLRKDTIDKFHARVNKTVVKNKYKPISREEENKDYSRK